MTEHTRHIRCSPDNVEQFNALLRGWPELRATVQQMRGDGFITGLRDLSVTLHGDQPWPITGPDDLPAPEAA